MNIRVVLEDRISQGLSKAGAPQGSPGLVTPSNRPEFGDYQVNGVMAAAKKLKTNPCEFAQKVINELQLDDLADWRKSA